MNNSKRFECFIDQLDELAKEVVLETSNPDITAPELDLNNISINATPTNSDNPNGETIVKFTFRVKDNISGYKLGYYTFRDPQGLTSGYYHYPERRSEIFPTAEDLDWYEYTSTVVHKGEWEIFEWDKRTKTFPPSGGDIWSPQWYAKQKVMERGKYDNKGKKIEGV